MENPDKSFSEIVEIVRSWIPRRTDPTTLSRNFWMPDHSCRVCYDCDVQFTIFNRRHHCRICGRVFCAKCTSNSVPVSPDDQKNGREEGDRIRVCNFCYRQWQQEVAIAAAAKNELRESTPGLIPSPSVTSLTSTKSSCTANSSSSVAGSMPHSNRPYQRLSSYGSGISTNQPISLEPENEEGVATRRDMDSVPDIADPSLNQFGFCMNRSDDDDDEYGICRSDSAAQRFHHPDNYYEQVDFDEVDDVHSLHKVHPTEETIDAKDFTPINENTEFQNCSGIEKMVEEVGYECETSSSIYNMDAADYEPVDFENNGALWFPPPPENEEDDNEEVLFDDEDDDGAVGEFGYLRSSNSFGSGEFRSRNQSGEEHRKAMKNVVDGHFRALVSQLLQVENLPIGEENGKESWLEIIMSLSWEVATLLKPDTSKGGGMDPGGYVKIKCLASGCRSESLVVKGVVCRKNLAHRRMRSKIEKPRFLILGGALEYQRVSNHLSSFDTLLQQEKDHLKMAVAKIDAHRPNVLLVEKTVSRFAQDYLLAKDISLVLNMKRPLLERISRCTGAQIVPSIDHLSSQKLGHCDMFHVEKFFEEHNGKKLKTLMFFAGCPKPLGCTVLLKGGNRDELKKVKHVVQYGVFAAYHLALETSFLADEGASLPELPLKSPITVALPENPSSFGRSISTIPGFTIPAADNPQLCINVQRDSSLSSDPNSLSANICKMGMRVPQYSYETNNSQTKEYAPNSIEPSADLKGSAVKRSLDENFIDFHRSLPFSSPNPSERSDCCDSSLYCLKGERANFIEHSEEKSLRWNDQTNLEGFSSPAIGNKFSETIDGWSSTNANSQIDEKNNIHKQTGPSDLGMLNQNNDLQDYQASQKEDFPPSPSNHQSILVSLSTRCVWKGTVCERAHLFRIKYYGSFDKPLGRFLRDHLFDQGSCCRSCEMPSEAHVHCYTHRQGSLTISVNKLPGVFLPGEREGKIWMWHRCLRCPRKGGIPPETKRNSMSDAAWGLSFGKFLELSFSNHAAASRVANCGHSLHRDCLRFYGFGPMVACFRYASIDVHSVYLPPPQLDFNMQIQDWIQNEVNEVSAKAHLLFDEVLGAIHQISEKKLNTGLMNNNLEVPELRNWVVDLKSMLNKEKAEFEESLNKISEKNGKQGQPVIDIFEINKLRRKVVLHSYIWDQRLVFIASLDSKSPHFNGIIMKTGENLGSIERRMELNSPSKSQKGVSSLDSLSMDTKNNELLKVSICPVAHQEGVCNHPCQHSLDPHEQEVQLVLSYRNENQSCHSTTSNPSQVLDPLESGVVVRRALSDGQAPLLSNLSDTLEAKWIGDNAPALVDVPKPDSSDAIEKVATLVSEEHLEGHGRREGSLFLTVALPNRVADGAGKDFYRWFEMSFPTFYHSIYKNPTGSAPLSSLLYEYNPVYVSSFRDLERQGGARLLLPVGVSDTDIPVYDDEPTSIIAYALGSHDYHSQMSDERERIKDGGDSSVSLPFYDSGSFHPFPSFDEISSETFRSIGSFDDTLLTMSGSRSSLSLDPLLYTKALHARVSFSDEGPLGKVKYTVTCYYAKRFDALRRTCCRSELDFIRSLSRCKKWGAQGGKSNVFFAKSLDDRFIIKQVTKTELESFIKFAPEYFKYLSESITSGSPTCLAKILGIYQITSKHLKGGKESKMDVLVMENLLYGRNLARLYDLKGSARSRYNADSSGNNKVLLDQNLIEAMPTSPIFVGNKAKRLLERAVWNDTAFLASIDVMDYSLLVGVDEERHELVLGIIDFMRQYTWDKHLETWVKASGILGGPKNASPTVISPKQYKKRFRKAMSAYFLMVPDQWSPPSIIPSRSQSDLGEDNIQELSLES